MPPGNLTSVVNATPPPLDFYQFKVVDWQAPPNSILTFQPPNINPSSSDYFSSNLYSIPTSINPVIVIIPLKPIMLNTAFLAQADSSFGDDIVDAFLFDKYTGQQILSSSRGGPVGAKMTSGVTGFVIDYGVDCLIKDRKTKKYVKPAIEFGKEAVNVYIKATWDTGVIRTTGNNLRVIGIYAQHYSGIITTQAVQLGQATVYYARQLGHQVYQTGTLVIAAGYTKGLAGFHYVKGQALTGIRLAAPYAAKGLCVVAAAAGGYAVGTMINYAADNGSTTARWVRQPIQYTIHYGFVDAPEGYQWEYSNVTGHYECVKNPLLQNCQQKLVQIGFYLQNSPELFNDKNTDSVPFLIPTTGGAQSRKPEIEIQLDFSGSSHSIDQVSTNQTMLLIPVYSNTKGIVR